MNEFFLLFPCDQKLAKSLPAAEFTRGALYSVWRFHYDKIGIMPLVALCSLYGPKIIKFDRCIQLLQAKLKVGPV